MGFLSNNMVRTLRRSPLDMNKENKEWKQGKPNKELPNSKETRKTKQEHDTKSKHGMAMEE